MAAKHILLHGRFKESPAIQNSGKESLMDAPVNDLLVPELDDITQDDYAEPAYAGVMHEASEEEVNEEDSV
jgi:hypothetical protein